MKDGRRASSELPISQVARASRERHYASARPILVGTRARDPRATRARPSERGLHRLEATFQVLLQIVDVLEADA